MNYEQIIQEKIENIRHKKDVLILAIESSCDETSIAIVKNGRQVLANTISTQIEIHKRFGGVVPEVASRNHVLAINNVLNECLDSAKLTLTDIDAIAVTYGAGLAGALMVGVNFAKSLAYALQKPLIAVNHIQGHISANYLAHNSLKPPFICLVVSGGHTAILKCTDFTKYEKIGSTLDDAVGECFDKVARVLGLGYPGGPKIDKLAKDGNANINFVTSDTLANTYNFSYSGIKTAVINYLHQKEQLNEQINVADICASFETEAMKPLITKAVRASQEFNINKIVLAGGVAGNSYLRENLQKECDKNSIEFYCPPLTLCTDNAAMIGAQAYFNLMESKDVATLTLSPSPNLKL